MKPAKIIKIDKSWKCIFDSKKGKSEKPVTDKALVEWLNKVIESPDLENDILIQDDTGLKQIKYGELVFPPIHDYQKAKDIPNQPNQNKNINEYNFQRSNNAEKFARSPYNFVPLNDTNAELVIGLPKFDRYIKDTNSGYLDVEVTNLTPLFIRQVSSKEHSFKYGNDNFGIPGSSFRGLIRQMSEVISFGSFRDNLDNYLYFRGSRDNMPNVHSGVMQYDKLRKTYKIYRCQYRNIDRNCRINKIPNFNQNGFEFTTGKIGSGNYNKFEFFEIEQYHTFEILEKTQVYLDYKNDKNRAKDTYDVYAESEDSKFPVFFQLSLSGEISSIGFAKYHRIPFKKSINDHIPEGLRKSKSIEDADLVQSLFGDSFNNGNDIGMIASRLSFGDLMSSEKEVLNDKSYLLKILASPKPTTFQHYLEQGLNAKKADKNWNSDANIRGNKMYWHRETKKLDELTTCVEFENVHLKYQDDVSFDLSWNEPWDANMDNEINPKTNKEFKTDSHAIRIKPIKPNATFKGKIWFQNLTDLELGLILMALEPSCAVSENEIIAHKIGLAKPLGLGSIKVKIASLKVFDMSKEGYFSSFEPSQPTKEINIEEMKNIFDAACAKALGVDSGSIWDTQRLKELKEMMVWEEKEVVSNDWLQKTRYMEIERAGKPALEKNEFKKRPILPKPTLIKSKPNSDFI